MEWTGHSLGMYIWMSGSVSKWHYVTTNGIIVSQFGWMTFPLGVKNGNCSSESNIILYAPFCWLGVNSALSFHLSCYFDEHPPTYFSSEPTATRYMPLPTDVNKIGPQTIVCLKVMWIKDWWNRVQGLVPFGGLDRCAGRFAQITFKPVAWVRVETWVLFINAVQLNSNSSRVWYEFMRIKAADEFLFHKLDIIDVSSPLKSWSAFKVIHWRSLSCV